MISSMTGYGRGEVTEGWVTANAEIRTVNSRFLEITVRLPRSMALRENEVKELVRGKITRGKINIVINLIHENSSEVPLKINASAARAYFKILSDLKKAVSLRERITLDHLLKFPEVLDADEFEAGDEEEWRLTQKALEMALNEVSLMRQREGKELFKDLCSRVESIDKTIDEIEQRSKENMPRERLRLEEKLKELVADNSVINANRLELELALFADKVDVTEECVRFRSHNKFFLEACKNPEAAGRKLNFLVQEMNREANTIGSKSADAPIAHIVVAIKEELEKIREQLQNIE